ncbi:putative pectinesterase 63 [Dichanthelium oligosanthes]|uniref:Pectinesterase n=1 Tax=Dichanthelium oligosanthes TaxID=888268 RepID=A0A1E5V0Q3_9POAL|nr:putative pectinesterase 63 [Dichanthelium oligosanthes]
MAMRKETLFLSLILGLLVLGSLPAPSRQEGDFDKWVALEQANAGKDVGGGKKDPKLTSAEASTVSNGIDPTNNFGGKNGYYKTISESIANIPDDSTKRYVLDLKPGTVFREKVFLKKSKPFVTFKSDPSNPAIIVWNDTATTLGKDGKPLGTVGSATVTVESDYFMAYGVIFKNDAPLPKPGAKKGQAPALRVMGTKAAFYNCTIIGGQVALYDQKGLHYFKDCVIKGTIDFIFGFARSLYEACSIVSINKDIVPKPAEPQASKTTVAAAGAESGFSFKNCTIKGEGQKIYLGRVLEGSRAVYSYTEMGMEVVPIILDRGNINYPKSGTYYGNFKCAGPGLDAVKKDKLALDLTDAQVKPFLGTNFISGESWILPPPKKDK